MKTSQFTVSIADKAGVYECKVEEFHEKKETYYHVDILSPRPVHEASHMKQHIYNIEMRIDCNTGSYKIKKYVETIPKELLEIEQRLSNALCKRSKKAAA